MLFVSGSEFVSDRFWLQAAIAQMDKKRLSIFEGIRGKQFRFGSDCTGADAAFQAGSQWVEFQGGESENAFASEAPGATGPMLFQLLNHRPKKLFHDMLARGFSGPCLVAGGSVPTPTDIHMYSAGTMCNDFSGFNTLNPKENLGLLFMQHCVSVFSIPDIPRKSSHPQFQQSNQTHQHADTPTIQGYRFGKLLAALLPSRSPDIPTCRQASCCVPSIWIKVGGPGWYQHTDF